MHDHLYTIDELEVTNLIAKDGYALEGVAGYVHEMVRPGTTRLIRLFNADTDKHFFTTKQDEADLIVANEGYRNEGTDCYVYPDLVNLPEGIEASFLKPLMCLHHPSSGDYFYTIDLDEANVAVAYSGYQSKGVVCYMHDLASAPAGSVPLYHLQRGGKHKVRQEGEDEMLSEYKGPPT
ncbi:MAG: hypothetical protein JO202_08410 [Ktedonobacteraceae bacterium]|nr:hypothetical protein [Ktedonobacteraceae bacterium]